MDGDLTIDKIYLNDDIRAGANLDINAVLPEALGAQRFRVKNSALATVFSVDSVGDVSLFGDLTGNAGTEDIYTEVWTDYGGTSTIIGWNPVGLTANIWYKRVGKLVYVSYYITGTSNAIVSSFTLPHLAMNSTNYKAIGSVQYTNGGFASTIPGRSDLVQNTLTVALYTDWAGAAWANVNQKTVQGQFVYEAKT